MPTVGRQRQRKALKILKLSFKWSQNLSHNPSTVTASHCVFVHDSIIIEEKIQNYITHYTESPACSALLRLNEPLFFVTPKINLSIAGMASLIPKLHGGQIVIGVTL